MTIVLGDNPLTQVKILEVAGKPPIAPPPPPLPKLKQTQYVDASKQTLPGEQTVDLVDPIINQIPQGRPKKPAIAQHYGLEPTRKVKPSNKFPDFPEGSPRGSLPTKESSMVEDGLNGVAMGLVDAFLDPNAKDYRDNPYLAKNSYQYERGSYQVGLESGKALRAWLRDRKKDIKNWVKDLTKPKSHPETQDKPRPDPTTPQPSPAPEPPPQEPEWPINWPDIFPNIPEIPFPQNEPNFDQFDPEFNFDEYKKVKPKPEKKKDKKDFPIEKPIPPKLPTVDNSNDQQIFPSLEPPAEQDIDFPPLQGTFTFKFSFYFIGETVVNRADWYFNFLKATGQATSKNNRVFFYNDRLIEYSGEVTDPRGLRCRVSSQNSETTRYTWYIFARDVNAFGVPKPGIPVGNYYYFRLPNTEQINQFVRSFYTYDNSLWQANKTDRTKVTPVSINIDVPKILPPEHEPPSIKKENKVTTCLFDEEKIKRLIRSLKAKIEIPVVEAIKKKVNGNEIWVPKVNRTQVEVLAIDENTAASMALIYRKIAEIQIDLIKMRNTEPPIAVIPEWWQVRIGSDRPQLSVVYAGKNGRGSLTKSRWNLVIPHYNGNKNPRLPSYTKGNIEGILTLSDNSKLIINTKSAEECERVLSIFKSFINPVFLRGAHIKIGERKGLRLKQQLVVPTIIRFFSQGQRNLSPDWVSDLRDR